MTGKCGSHCWWKVVIRVSIAAVFIYAGYGKLANIAGTAGAITAVMAWPYATFFAWVAGLIEFVGGILLATGYYKKWAAYALIVFTVIATYYFHLKGAIGGDAMQWVQVLKNLAIVGALAMFAGCGRCGSCGDCGDKGDCGNCKDKNGSCGNCEGGKCGGCSNK